MLVLPLASADDQHTANLRMRVTDAGAELGAAASGGVGDEDRRNRPAGLGVPLEGTHAVGASA